MMTNKFGQKQSHNNRTSVFLILVFVFCFIFSTTNVYAQTSRPTPTPRQEIPTVVSRDEDIARDKPIEDVREIDDQGNTIKLPIVATNQTKISTEDTTKLQKKMMLYLDLLTKVEQRASSLQNQLFDLVEKQNELTTKIKQLEYQLRPEVISSTTGLTGSLRPEDLREQRKEALALEKSNYEALLLQLDNRKSRLEQNVQKADALVEKIRVRFDKVVDDALNEELDFL